MERRGDVLDETSDLAVVVEHVRCGGSNAGKPCLVRSAWCCGRRRM